VSDAVLPAVTDCVAPRLVSVLIVNYRAYDELRACLASLQPFVAPDLEVVVVDHDSQPADFAAVVRQHPWVHWLPTSENRGFAAGVNRAAGVARGQFLLLLNPDCVLQGDVARELAAALDERPRAAVAGGIVRESDGTLQASARRFPGLTTGLAGRTSALSRWWPSNPLTRRNLAALAPGQRTIDVDWVSGACLLVRRAAFDLVGGMDEQFFLYWEDADLCYRLKQRGWGTIYTATSGVTHHTGRSSARQFGPSRVAFHRSAFRYHWKHAGVIGRLLAPLVWLALYGRLAIALRRSGDRSAEP